MPFDCPFALSRFSGNTLGVYQRINDNAFEDFLFNVFQFYTAILRIYTAIYTAI